MASLKVSGIYEIVNRTNGKRYVGSAVDIAQRWRQHRCELGKGRHNPILQRAWLKYGAENFEFRIIEYVADKAALIEREQFYLDQMQPEYNVAVSAGSNFGVRWSAETKARMGEASKRVWSSPDHRRRMSEVHKAYEFTPEHKAAISAALSERQITPEHAAKIAANNTSRNKSPEHRAKMSAYWKGRAKTPEQIAKMAETKRGRPAHNRGKPMSAEQKAKQSAAMKLKYANDPAFRVKISETTRAAMRDYHAKRRSQT